MEKKLNNDEKNLLIKDICARLPYKVKVSYYDNENEREECDVVDSIYEDTQEIGVGQWCLNMDKFKPYLFPMSSMTDEQKKEFLYTLSSDYNITYDTIDWLNKNHFDYRGLIEKGLAIDCTNLNIY